MTLDPALDPLLLAARRVCVVHDGYVALESGQLTDEIRVEFESALAEFSKRMRM
jgi:hypothetical protein